MLKNEEIKDLNPDITIKPEPDPNPQAVVDYVAAELDMPLPAQRAPGSPVPNMAGTHAKNLESCLASLCSEILISDAEPQP